MYFSLTRSVPVAAEPAGCSPSCPREKSSSVAWRDPEMRKLLDREKPGRRFRPVLVSNIGGRIRVRAGLTMCLALARAIGFRDTVRVFQLINTEPAGPTATGSPGSLSRRSVLLRGGMSIVGVVIGSGVTAGAAAAATPTVAPTILTDGATIEKLRANAGVVAASRSFGAPDWNAVHSAAASPGISCGAVATFVLTHPNSPGTYTAVAADKGDAVSFRLAASGEATTITWMSTSAAPWAISTLNARGLASTDVAPPSPAVSTAFARCFSNCIGACVSGSCLASCFTCATSLNFAGCFQCAACAGSSAVTCARICG
jgi:hypothetical protein